MISTTGVHKTSRSSVTGELAVDNAGSETNPSSSASVCGRTGVSLIRDRSTRSAAVLAGRPAEWTARVTGAAIRRLNASLEATTRTNREYIQPGSLHMPQPDGVPPEKSLQATSSSARKQRNHAAYKRRNC